MAAKVGKNKKKTDGADDNSDDDDDADNEGDADAGDRQLTRR